MPLSRLRRLAQTGCYTLSALAAVGIAWPFFQAAPVRAVVPVPPPASPTPHAIPTAGRWVLVERSQDPELAAYGDQVGMTAPLPPNATAWLPLPDGEKPKAVRLGATGRVTGAIVGPVQPDTIRAEWRSQGWSHSEPDARTHWLTRDTNSLLVYFIPAREPNRVYLLMVQTSSSGAR